MHDGKPQYFPEQRGDRPERQIMVSGSEHQNQSLLVQLTSILTGALGKAFVKGGSKELFPFFPHILRLAFCSIIIFGPHLGPYFTLLCIQRFTCLYRADIPDVECLISACNSDTTCRVHINLLYLPTYLFLLATVTTHAITKHQEVELPLIHALQNV